MLNVKNCDSSVGNTGYGDCPVDLKNITGFILTPKGFTLTAAQLLTKEATLAALQDATLAVAKNRIFPVNNIAALDGNIEDPVTETLGYGDIITLRDGNYNLNFRFVQGGLCLSNALRRFNSKTVELLLIDANGMLFGTKVGNELKSVPLVNFYQKAFSFNDGSGAVAGYMTNVVFKPAFINENIGFVDGENSTFWSSLVGLQDVILSETSQSAVPVLKIVASTGCNGESILEEFIIELSDEANWIAKNGETGATVTITSVVIVGKVATVTLDNEDADYPTSGTIKLSLSAPSVLYSAGIEYFESNILTIIVD